MLGKMYFKNIFAPTSRLLALRPWLPKLFRPLTRKDKERLGLSSEGVVKRAKNGSVPGTYIYIYTHNRSILIYVFPNY